MRRCLPVLLLAGGCGASRALPPRRAAVFDVAVVAGLGPKTTTELYAMQTEPVAAQAWEMRTLWTESTWEDPAGPISFDSRAPGIGDPWPMLTQHAVASMPAVIHFDQRAIPDAVLDVVHWEVLARAAIDRLDIPDEGKEAGLAQVDPEGLLRDARRAFPGQPDEMWVRSVRIAGLRADRVEQCERTEVEATVTWSCTGELVLPADGGAVLHETETWSTVVLDRRGLVSFEEASAGTIIHQRTDGMADEPFATRRLVRRRDIAPR